MSTMRTVMEQDGAKKFLNAIGRNSESSKTTYAVALAHLQNFLDTKQLTLKSIIKPLLINEIDVYELLDEFVTHLLGVKNGNDETMTVSNKSIKAYLAAVKSYLAYYDIDVIPAKFKRKVKMPKVYREDETALDAKDIREILLHCNNRRLKPFLLCLASCGARVNEITSLRHIDIDFDTSPTKINIRKEFTKTKRARYTFISAEASKFLHEWIVYRYRERTHTNRTPIKDDEDLVFSDRLVTSHEGIYTKLRGEFSKVLKLVGLEKRKEGMQRRTITLNSFRRFAQTTVSDQVSSDYSEWLIGHAKSSYWTKKDDEKQQIYKTKCMNYLTFLDYTTLEATGKNIETKLSQKDEELQQLKDQMSQMNEMIMDMREQGMYNTRRRLEDELRRDPSNEQLKKGFEKHKETARRLLKEGLMREEFYPVD